ncbi:DUF6853 family protein [Neisseria montereyensis]|uniref:Uncharacterized protein n=1 Tax=Neisseria montereyensis TaxID=2973938 RepID=A0ABT2FE02_9NEIS|nr:hypothetical protein [Neisseria montereyensis]MCS4534444.1 hypothetical protein [Neisseria montereyensis]
MKMNDFNSVRDALRELGRKQGIDLGDEEAIAKFNDEIPFGPRWDDSRWLCYYLDDWDEELEERLYYFFESMRKYQDAMAKEDIKSASSSFFLAVDFMGSLRSFFNCIENDMIKLLKGEDKTNDFQWPQFDDE